MNRVLWVFSCCFALIFSFFGGEAAVYAQSSSNASTASQASAALSAEGIGFVVKGSVQGAALSGQLAVASVKKTASGIVLVLKGAGKASTLTLQITGKAVGAASVAVGTSVQLVAESTGYLLIESGRILAFIPNELGKKLIGNKERN